ncbi:YbgC/FadM family acyl-CoA thioesterase [Chitinispirillales bacterium ANBcel5]|uniref:YbgC/FadM family acyl-CoA thioesterase n=1 Tax=Cellulosispirillum alkaliphilum TaxID=3039283 RepID=UPI002A535A8D|nr:YbgC/FadM family acyl-CoA thioesterase [Chitinispirillales bacterium ANBcel5]
MKNEITIRVYYEDTDCGNVVYYANYLKYMERGRTEFLRECGIELADYQSNDILFAVIDAKVKYKFPARYNDLLSVQTVIKEYSAASVTFSTSIFNQNKKLLSQGDVRLACINSVTGRPSKFPPEVMEAITDKQLGNR